MRGYVISYCFRISCSKLMFGCSDADDEEISYLWGAGSSPYIRSVVWIRKSFSLLEVVKISL